MQRSKQIQILCHCLLNANAKVFPLALCGGVYQTAVQGAIAAGVGLVQLPCPETCYLGMNRWGMTCEQYASQHFREFCRDLLRPSMYQITAFIAAGYQIIGVVGMDGSPNCGVNRTCSGFAGGEICSQADISRQQALLTMLPGKGVFMTVLAELLAEQDIVIPFTAIDEELAVDSPLNS